MLEIDRQPVRTNPIDMNNTLTQDEIDDLEEYGRRVAVCFGCKTKFVTYRADTDLCIWCGAEEDLREA